MRVVFVVRCNVFVIFRVIVIWEYQERHVNLTINIRKIKHE